MSKRKYKRKVSYLKRDNYNMILYCVLRHLMVNNHHINLFVDRKTLLLNLYVYLVCVCACTKHDCCLLFSSSSDSHIPLATFCGCKQASAAMARTRTYFLKQSKGCMFSYASLLFSLPFLLSLSQVLTVYSIKCKFFLSLIHTYIYSFLCTASRIETDTHLKHYRIKKNDYEYIVFIFHG
jgi:hypothetical protein